MLEFTKSNKTKLEVEIDRLETHLSNVDILDDDYELTIDRLKSLYELTDKKDKFKVSPDTLAVVAGNLLGIAIILKHEELNIVTTKALGFVMKGRV